MRLTKKWWFVIVVLPVIGLCVKAGFWQLDRAQQKEQLIERLTVGESQLSTPSDLLMVNPESATYRVTLPVMIDHDSVFYLDNRIQDRVAGYEVFAEASTRDGGLRLLVNLGWVPGSPTRDRLPENCGSRSISIGCPLGADDRELFDVRCVCRDGGWSLTCAVVAGGCHRRCPAWRVFGIRTADA
jgi:cytochrome oxidase assembly protein ShyY1